jgi:hypothetical protein
MRRFFSIALTVWLIAAAPAAAETFRLRYEAVILGVIALGEAGYEVTASPNRYAARASLRTSGAARLFDQTNISAAVSGSLSGAAIQWERYDLSHAYAHKFRRTSLRREAGAVVAEVTPPFRDMGAPPASVSQQAASFDPLTGLFALGRQVGAARACRGSVLVFDGRGHYRLTVVARGGQSRFRGGGYDGPGLTCTLRYAPIAGFNMSAAQRARIPEGEILFGLTGQSGFAPILRLTAPTPIGPAQLNLRSYEAR